MGRKTSRTVVKKAKDSGLIRQLSSIAKPAFYRAVFRQPLLLPEGALNYRWPAADFIVYYGTGGVTS